ncbi:HAD family hydrolase [Spirosoma foliorum]|uniref:HAD family hydrolase n=1 Tax=Spirosoma foliorum TaxID=2710596 RepID=A0A7G5H2J9_9BACT|nr:HAD family hydrolase [Spirosoma foliorum]QMW05341.1 HAD family hydrolase [Spirosoma foliorum]
MAIKQISFDFWNTLFRANPAYGEARNKYLAESKFNLNGLSASEVHDAYKSVDWRIDWLIDRTGYSYAPVQLYGMVAYELGYHQATSGDLLSMGEAFAELFQKHPPTLYSPDTLHVLKELSGLSYGISIGSNTGFIPGSLLRNVCLEPLDIEFNFMVFSDEIHYAKPHAGFFGEVYGKADNVFRFRGINRKQILHIGDNLITDVAGPMAAGLDAFLINDGTFTISDLMTKISHEANV